MDNLKYLSSYEFYSMEGFGLERYNRTNWDNVRTELIVPAIRKGIIEIYKIEIYKDDKWIILNT